MHFPLATTTLALASTLALSAAGRADDQLVAPGARWKYLDDGSNQGSAWRAPSFDDSRWAAGPAQLGYGDGDEATVVGYGPSASNKYITTWFRHAFQVPSPATYLGLELRLLRDDGAVVYLNGSEVLRSNMPAGVIDYQTRAASTVGGSEEDTFFSFSIPAGQLVAGRNVLAVEIHQRRPSSSDISFDLELRGLTTAAITRGPYLQNATPTAITLRWRTNLPTDSRVVYGAAPGALGSSRSDPTPRIEHELRLSSLAPATRTYYAVGTSAAILAGDSPQFFFVTPPPAGTSQPTRIWIVGDSGETQAFAPFVRDAYASFTGARHTDLWIMLGDNARPDGTDEQFQAALFDVFPAMLRKSVLYSTRGNHERSASVYYDTFTFPAAGEAGGLPSGTEAWYAFEVANIHFICLDSEGSDVSRGGPMWRWLQADLAANQREWTIVFFHHPPYSKGSHDSDSEQRLIEMRTNFAPLLESGAVDLVLCGHSHVYERSFLIDGHYGLSSSFTNAMKKDPGDGGAAGGPYHKAPIPHAGAVYAVVGCSSMATGGPLNHPAMVSSQNLPGSAVLDVDGGRLDFRFLDALGAVRDQFTLYSWASRGLSANTTTLSLPAPGSQRFELDAGAARAHKLYFLLGSLGTSPGLTLGAVTLPLNPDAYFLATIQAPNSSLLVDSLRTLDSAGRASARLDLPAGLPAALGGVTFFHAYAVLDLPGSGALLFASNPFPLTLLPW